MIDGKNDGENMFAVLLNSKNGHVISPTQKEPSMCSALLSVCLFVVLFPLVLQHCEHNVCMLTHREILNRSLYMQSICLGILSMGLKTSCSADIIDKP